MVILSYALDGKERPLDKLQTSTGAKKGSVKAIIKYDNEEAPTQVYSEFVANRLAQFLGLPVAIGVPINNNDGHVNRFASLWVSDTNTDGFFDFSEQEPTNRSLPDDEAAQSRDYYWEYKALCELYPIETAKLAVFDLWTGNDDRTINMKGILNAAHHAHGVNRLYAIDQGSSLLSCSYNVTRSIERLESDTFPSRSPMQGFVNQAECSYMVERIRSIPDWALESAVLCDIQIGSVMPDMQYMLLDILDKRRKFLSDMVQRVLFNP